MPEDLMSYSLLLSATGASLRETKNIYAKRLIIKNTHARITVIRHCFYPWFS